MQVNYSRRILKILSLVAIFWTAQALAENPPVPQAVGSPFLPVAFIDPATAADPAAANNPPTNTPPLGVPNQQAGELLASCIDSNKAIRAQIKTFSNIGSAITSFSSEIVKANPALGLAPNPVGIRTLLMRVLPRQATPKRGPIAVRDYAMKEVKYAEDLKSAKDCFDIYKAGLAYENAGINLVCQLAEIMDQDDAIEKCVSQLNGKI